MIRYASTVQLSTFEGGWDLSVRVVTLCRSETENNSGEKEGPQKKKRHHTSKPCKAPEPCHIMDPFE